MRMAIEYCIINDLVARINLKHVIHSSGPTVWRPLQLLVPPPGSTCRARREGTLRTAPQSLWAAVGP